jgi:CBS domain-containing protein
MKTLVPISTLLHHKGSTVWHIEPDATVFEAIKLMADKNIGSLPVMTGDRLVGMFTERDYARKIVLQGRSSRETKVRDVLSTKIAVVTPDHSIEDCMKLMTENRVRHLPVMDGQRMIGIVSIGDLVNWIISTQNATIEQMEQYIAGSVAV